MNRCTDKLTPAHPHRPHTAPVSLDYTPLINAIAQWEKSLAYAHSPATLADAGLRQQLCNAVNKCCEFPCELSWNGGPRT